MSTSEPHRAVWPWAAGPAAAPLPPSGLPKISIVTPSYNQARYLEETLLTVLAQGYPDLEYILMEDGSTDGSAAIVERHRHRFAQVVARPNRGFGAVLHDGLSRSTGDIMAWLNSDDLYLPHTLATVGSIFRDCPGVDWICGRSLLGFGAGSPVRTVAPAGFNRQLFFSGRYLGGHPAWNGQWIPQESVFWRRSLWDKAGGYFLQERLQYGDFELWSRFWKHADLHMVRLPLGVYRQHAATYTSVQGSKSTVPCTRLLEEAGEVRSSRSVIRLREILARIGGKPRERFGYLAKIVDFDDIAERWTPGLTRVS